MPLIVRFLAWISTSFLHVVLDSLIRTFQAHFERPHNLFGLVSGSDVSVKVQVGFLHCVH